MIKYPSVRWGQAFLRGAIPGLILGGMAGLLEYSLNHLIASIQEPKEEYELMDNTVVDHGIIDTEQDVKTMTVDELKREIEQLKSKRL
jgi:hypothetical protein